MTNKEILKADILDILFENRNKTYGAYALRKTYDSRLLTALTAGLGFVFLLILASTRMVKDNKIIVADKKEGLVVKEYTIPLMKTEKPLKQEQLVKQKPVVKTAQVKFTSKFDIKKDELVKNPVTSVSNLSDKKPGEDNITGKPDDNTVKKPVLTVSGADTVNNVLPQKPDEFFARETAPEFPGGPAALHKFLSDNLQTPDELDAGEKKLVKVKFIVDAGGVVNNFEIVTSGGKKFDNEVLRVCRKMPRWVPAFQNGIHVPVTYMIPVTFIGIE